MGVRLIEVDILDGTIKDGQLVPAACNDTSTLDKVLETIKRHAFAKSEYPLIVSLNVRCNHDNQKAAASLIKDTFGESLFTGPISRTENELLPSPEELKGKILLKAQVDREEKDEEEKVEEDEVEFYIGDVWFCIPSKDREWRKKEMIWGNETLSFVAPKQQIVIELCAKPYFVGYMRRDTVEKCMNEVEEKSPGSFLVFCNQAYTEFMLSVCSRRGKIIHFPLAYDCKSMQYFFDTDIDREQKFATIDDLVEHYTANNITISLAKLSEPLCLTKTSAHKHMEWFCGDLDSETCSELMATIHEKGAFLVREEETFENTNFVIEYFDGQTPQQVKIVQEHAGRELILPEYKSCNAQTIIEVVNHFRVNYLKNATKLGNAVQIVGEVLEDHEMEGEGMLTRGQKMSIRRKSREMFVDKNGRALDPTKIELSARVSMSQSIPEELRYDIASADIKKEELNSLFLKYPHNTRLVMTANEVGGADEQIEINFTMEEDIELVFNGLSREVAQIEGERRTSSKGKGQSGYWTRPRTNTIILGTELADLVIFESKVTLDKNLAERCNTRTRLKRGGQFGLIRKLDWSDCLDHTQITTVDNVALKVKGNITPFNIGSFIEFHQSFMTKVYPPKAHSFSTPTANYDPIPIWQSGVQAATLNLHADEKEVQGTCNPIQVNNAMFLDTNGGCGYVEKPERLMTCLETSCIITLKILEGRHLKTLKHPREQLLSPHLEVNSHLNENKCLPRCLCMMGNQGLPRNGTHVVCEKDTS